MFIQARLMFLQIILHSTSLKAGNTEQDTYQLPFYCNFDFTSLVSAHAQTINEYPDTKRQIWMFGDNYPDNWVSVPALLCTQNDHIVSI